MHLNSKLLSCLGVAGLLASVGTVQAMDADADKRVIPATQHQTESLKLKKQDNPDMRYQISRKGADYIAVMPVTKHQADVLNINPVTRSDQIESTG